MAGTAWTGSDFDDVTETFYYKKLNEARIARSALMRDIAKRGGWTGNQNFRVSVDIGRAQGVSRTLTRAQTRNSPPKYAAFLLTPEWKYGTAKIDKETLTFVKDDKSLVNALMKAMDSTREQMLTDLARDLYGSGYGVIGKIATSGISGNNITLTNSDDAKNFFLGMGIVADNNETGATPKAGSTYVTARNLMTGIITLNNAADITGTLADADFLFRDGDENGCITGFFSPYDSTSTAGWCPNTAPTVGGGDAFFTEDRSRMVPELTGWSIDGTSGSIEEVFIEAGAQVSRLGTVTDVYMNGITYGNRMKTAGSKIVMEQGGDVEIGFTGMRLMLPSGPAKVHIDPQCPINRILGVNLAHIWIQYANDSLIHFADPRGSNWHQLEGADEFENRLRFCGQVACDTPWQNFNIQIDES